MLGNENRMSSHRCLFAVILEGNRGKSCIHLLENQGQLLYPQTEMQRFAYFIVITQIFPIVMMLLAVV